jgi:hypothetical protein
MERKLLTVTLQPLLIDATEIADKAERLRASLEDRASVLPPDFLQQFERLVAALRDLRDDTALPRRQRPDSQRPPAKL